MAQSDAASRESILSFSHFLGAGRSDDDARKAAEERRWIAPCGAPTDEGRALVRALQSQRGTRTVLRGV